MKFYKNVYEILQNNNVFTLNALTLNETFTEGKNQI